MLKFGKNVYNDNVCGVSSPDNKQKGNLYFQNVHQNLRLL